MVLTSTLKSKGQITIPATLRQKMQWSEGIEVIFEERDGSLVLTSAEDLVNRTAGSLAAYAKPDEPLEYDRDEIWSEMALERWNRVLDQDRSDSANDPD